MEPFCRKCCLFLWSLKKKLCRRIWEAKLLCLMGVLKKWTISKTSVEREQRQLQIKMLYYWWPQKVQHWQYFLGCSTVQELCELVVMHWWCCFSELTVLPFLLDHMDTIQLRCRVAFTQCIRSVFLTINALCRKLFLARLKQGIYNRMVNKCKVLNKSLLA